MNNSIYEAEEIFAAVPQQLKDVPTWVCFDLEHRDAAVSKVPKNPETGFNAKSNDPSTWSNFETCVAAVLEKRHDGINFALVRGNGIVGLDFDHCVDPETGEVHPEVKAILGQVGSYAERSVSGSGIHVFVKATLPEDVTWRKASLPGGGVIEIGCDRHFLTVTGDHVEGTPTTIEERTEIVGELYRNFFPPKIEAIYDGPSSPSPLSDAEIIRKMCEASPRMKKLWAGDMSDFVDESTDGVDHSVEEAADKHRTATSNEWEDNWWKTEYPANRREVTTSFRRAS